MEPLHNYQGEHYEEEHTKPHVVYRKKAPKQQTSREGSACDTSGKQNGSISHFSQVEHQRSITTEQSFR